eukprot:SM000104S09333  [mRNA]  locus=s104:143159:152628:+ [translate_table: standard]
MVTAPESAEVEALEGQLEALALAGGAGNGFADLWTVYEQVAVAAMDCNSPAVADRCVEALMRRFPDSLRVSRLKGMLLEAKGWYNQADNVYSSLLVEHPTEAVLHKRRVAMLKAKGDLVGAVDALKEYLDIFMADHDAWRELADIYITLQMLKQAAFCYEELLLSQPTNCLYTLTYAEILYTIGGPDNVRSARKFFAAAAEYSGGKNTRALYGICLRFPLKAAGIAGGLAVVGDGIAQGLDAVRRRRDAERATDGMAPCCRKKALAKASQYDFVRAARMGSYGFLLYGPFSQKWYEFLEGVVPGKELGAISKKASGLTSMYLSAEGIYLCMLQVVANQLILGPTVLLMVYGWNFLCMGKLRELPQKYKRDMWPSLVDGWKFWIPASVVNFGAVPLEARVAFMSTCAIFWNLYLSRSASKA